MNSQPMSAKPALRPGCRLSPASNPESLLLIPEGALRLHGPGRHILELCDGQRTLTEVVDQLHRQFPTADAERIATEAIQFLERLAGKGAIEFL
jgi:pyrroloquinoline quinone biosynthesis protein D